jgi:hypothetical protein
MRTHQTLMPKQSSFHGCERQTWFAPRDARDPSTGLILGAHRVGIPRRHRDRLARSVQCGTSFAAEPKNQPADHQSAALCLAGYGTAAGKRGCGQAQGDRSTCCQTVAVEQQCSADLAGLRGLAGIVLALPFRFLKYREFLASLYFIFHV